ncbi:MAG: DUF2500 family protein [Symbiobacteriia bacterium]
MRLKDSGTRVEKVETTFEFEDGERIELPVGDQVYGEIAGGDVGMLTNQGTRFFGFERERL